MALVRTTYKCERPMTWARWRSTLDNLEHWVETFNRSSRSQKTLRSSAGRASRVALFSWAEKGERTSKWNERSYDVDLYKADEDGEVSPCHCLSIRKNVARGCPGENVWDECWNWGKGGDSLTTSFDQYYQFLFWWGCRTQIHPQLEWEYVEI